jgi:hypothetical protein
MSLFPFRGVALTNCDGQTDRTKTICLPTKVGGDIKTPQLTKDQRYDKLKWKRTFQTLWKATPLKLMNRIS